MNELEKFAHVTQQRTIALILKEQEVKTRAAVALAEREELTREYIFEVMARECGRDTAMRALQRIRLVEKPAEVADIGSIGPRVVP